MSAPAPYLLLAGRAREALTFYAAVFGGRIEAYTFADFKRDDGPADAIAHGSLAGGPVSLFAADAVGDVQALQCRGLMLSLLGTADPDTLRRWFGQLAENGQVVHDLRRRPWGATDGQVIDTFGVHWLIGFEGD